LPIFQKSVINSIKQDESLVASRWNNFQNYIAKIDAIRGFKEEVYQDGFFKDIFESCLGYTLKTTNPNDYNLEREKKNETDGKKADGVIYVNGEIIGVVELKDQKTKNLDQVEGQAFNYHASHSNSKYIIISNFDELRFYIDKKTAYEKFNLFNLSYEDFRTLHLLISYESIKENIPLKLKEKSTNFEQTISKELYRDFSAFRTHLFENILKNNDMDRSLLLRLTQKLCDRIIFILFAEDRELLKKETIKEIRTRHSSDGFGDRSLYDYYKLYFNAINTGNDKLGIPKYNGGLFATDELLDTLIIDDAYLDMEAQKLSDFDFVSEISVNILGHIFEQSLTDLEEMNASINDTEFDKKKSKRKKDGVFYTPEYITRYIVENTLGKLCTAKKEELKIESETVVVNPRKLTKAEQNYKEILITYREWLTHLKILDPACGSGAFLNQALEFLIREHTLIRDLLLPYEDLMIGYEVEKSILEHNLYGVDINEDAVEIAKLSLWLRTAHKGRELINLGAKIKCGNSLISDKTVADNAFVWEEEFPEVFEHGGFDVVIGNPPYGAQLSEEHKKYFYEHFKTVEYQLDTYTLFMEMLSFLTAPKGKVGYIIPSTWLAQNYFKILRHYLIENFTFDKLILFKYDVFENVTAETSIFIAEHSISSDEQDISFCVANDVNEFDRLDFQSVKHSEWVQNYDKGFNLAFDTDQTAIIRQMESGTVRLDEIAEVTVGIKPYQTNKGTPKQTSEDVKNRLFDSSHKIDESYKQYLVGSDLRKFIITPDSTRWIKYGKHLAEPRESLNFFQQKIIVRQTSDIIISAVDYEGFLDFNNIHNIVLKSQEPISYEALSVILNSSLMDVYYTYLVPEKGRVFAEVKSVNLRKLPIKLPTKEQNDTLTAFYNKMAEIKKSLSMLQSDFKLYLTTVLSVAKIPSKLDTPEKMSFDELQSALTKLKVDMKDFSIFRSIKQLYDEMMALQKEADRVDGEIDKVVGELYGFSAIEIEMK
jgi:type I restriction-modification system DNA methylase subunit